MAVTVYEISVVRDGSDSVRKLSEVNSDLKWIELHCVFQKVTAPSNPIPIMLLTINPFSSTNNQWTLFITRSRLLFYFVFSTRLICFRTIYQLQMALGV